VDQPEVAAVRHRHSAAETVRAEAKMNAQHGAMGIGLIGLILALMVKV